MLIKLLKFAGVTTEWIYRTRGFEKNGAWPSGSGGGERGISNHSGGGQARWAFRAAVGDLEVTEYITRVCHGRWSEKTVHPSTWLQPKQDSRFMPDYQSLLIQIEVLVQLVLHCPFWKHVTIGMQY